MRAHRRLIDFEHVVTLAWLQWLYDDDDDDVERMAAAGFEVRKRRRASEAGKERRRRKRRQGGRKAGRKAGRQKRGRGDRDGGCPINFQLDWLGGAQRRRERERDVINREGNEKERMTTSYARGGQSMATSGTCHRLYS